MTTTSKAKKEAKHAAAIEGPHKFETDVALKDGSLAHVRPADARDRELLQTFVKSLSSDTRGLRFQKARTPAAAARELEPGPERFGLIALRGEAAIGHAMYSASEPAKAGFSTSVPLGNGR